MKKLILIISIGMLLVGSGNAQNRKPLFGVSYAGFTKSNLQNPPQIGNLDNAEVSYQSVELFGTLRLIKTEKTTLATVLKYNQNSVDYGNFGGINTNIKPDNLYTFDIKLLLMQTLKGNLSFMALLSPSVSSDLKDDFSSDDMLYTGALLLNYKLSEQFTLGGGLVSSYDFGEQRIIPTLNIKYTSLDEKFYIDARFPKLIVSYQVAKRFDIGINAAQEGSKYNFRNTETENGDTSDYIKYSSLNVGPSLSYEIFENISIHGQFGFCLGRTLEVYSTDNELIGDLTPKNNTFIEFGLSYGLSQ